VITGLCTREDDCVEVCIDAETCIDCGAWVPACPPEAIFAEGEVPPEYEDDIARDVAFFSEGPGYGDFDLEVERRPC
jgi:Fe-S-cluster-containing hydrogenase component 2